MGGGLFLAAWLFLFQQSYGESHTPIERPLKGPSAVSDQVISQSEIFENDPLAAIMPQPGSQRLSVHLRFINHGLKIKNEFLDNLIDFTEKTYDTCPGIDFKIINDGLLTTEKTTLQDELTTPVDRSLVTNNFFNFFGPASYSKPSGVIDIHLVDFLSKEARDEAKGGKSISTIYEGGAYSRLIHVLKDNRLPENQNPPLSFYEDNIVIAYDTVMKTDGRLIKIYAQGSGPLPNQPHKFEVARRPYSNYLLAHELGHILMDRNMPEGFKDHFCPSTGAHCTGDYLMTAGGFYYNVYYDPDQKNKIVGYGTLPKIDPQQCKNLKGHPSVSTSP